MPEHVGFTGTQLGMTPPQWKRVRAFLADLDVILHHGDCIGADEDVHIIACHQQGKKVVLHPPEDDSKRAFCKGASEIRRAKPYLERNREIVNDTAWLLATPKAPEERRSGTWATVRYARAERKRIVFVWPDGRLTEEPAKE